MASNLHKIPANFEIESRSFPFKVTLRKKSQNSFECSIEPNSLVYDFYNDSEIKISGIDKVYPVQAGDKIILVLNYTQAGLVISSASIKITNQDPAQAQLSACFPTDEYYLPSLKCVTKTETLIASIEEETGSPEYELKAIQNVYHHFTKFACFTTPSQF